MLLYSKYWKSITPFRHCHIQDNFFENTWSLVACSFWYTLTHMCYHHFQLVQWYSFQEKSHFAKNQDLWFLHFLKFLCPFFCNLPKWSCSKIVWHPRKCPKVTFVDIFIENVSYIFIFYQHINSLDWNSMKKDIFKNKQVWKLNQDNHFLSLRA